MGALALARDRGAPPRMAGVALSLAVIAALAAILFVYAPHFFSVRNFINILIQSSSLGVMAVGLTFVMIVGGIDLSIPATMAFAAVMGAFVMPVFGTTAGVATMLAAGLAVGAFKRPRRRMVRDDAFRCDPGHHDRGWRRDGLAHQFAKPLGLS